MPDKSDSERYVSVELVEGNVAVVRLDRPKMNALSIEVVRQIGEAVEQLSANLPGAIVVWGGERLFAAGADIEELSDPDSARVVTDGFHASINALGALPRVSIAAVTGYALGGGCELALGCDFRVVSESARLGLPEILLGVIPGGGGTQRLARLVGPARALELICSGRQIKADHALSIGLADRVVPADEVFENALGWAREFAKGALVAQGLAKAAVYQGLEGSLADGLALERRLFEEVFRSEDSKIGVQSFLANGPGKAAFTGR